jgi:hypothetical protein
MSRTWLLLAPMTLAVATGPAAAQTIAFGVGGQLTGEANGRVRVPVYADLRAASGVALGSYTLRLTWDPNVLYFESVNEGSFGQPTLGADSAYYGVLKVGGLSANGVQGLVDLFAVNFSIEASQTTAVTLTVTEAIAAGTFTDLTPQVTVVSGLYCPAVGRWGDLDGDGQANSRDALAILSAVVGLSLDPTFTLSLGDVDGDGLVNSRDALITLSHAVGLAVPGQRVLLYVPDASCSSGMSNGVTILPDTVDVAVGQRVRMVMLGSVDGLPSGTSAEWQVADPDIAVVTSDGLLSGRAAGTTTVTALLGPGITASAPVIVRARRPVWHVDAARAMLAAVQLGTQRYPFATPQYAFPVAQEGDTVLVAPGVHDYLAGDLCTDYSGGGDSPPPATGGSSPAPPPEDCVVYGYITRGVVLMGDTLPDGTRPVLRGSRDASTAIQTDQEGWADIQNLVFRNFPGPIGSSGPSRFLRLTNVQIDIGLYGTGISTNGSLDSLVLENVALSGDTAGGGDLIDVDYASLVRIDGLIGRNRSGIYLYDVDSVDIRNSDVRTFYYPLYVYGYYSGAQTVRGIYLGDNRFEVHSDEVLGLFDVLRVTSERNTYIGGDVGSYNIIDVEGSDTPPRPGSWLIMSEDSVIRRQDVGSYSYSPIYVLDLDTIRLDSVIQVQPDSGMVNYGSVLAGNNIEVLRSVFENQGSSYPFYLDGRNLTVSGSRFTGCRTACGTRYGVELWSYSDSIARVEVSDNTFYQLYRPIQISSSSSVHRVLVTGNTIDSVTQGMNLYGDSITVADNVITRASSYGIYASSNSYNPVPYGLMQRNKIFMIGSSGQALEWYNGDLASEGNYYGGTFRGAYVYNSSGVTRTVSLLGDTLLADSALSSRAAFITGPWNATVRGNRILGGEYGLLGDGATTLTLDSNVVTGSSVYGAQLGGSAAYTVTGAWNNFKDNAGSGLFVYGGATAKVTDGRFVGNGGYGVVAGSQTTVDASNNWWGYVEGPNLAGFSDSTSGSVTWDPYLTADPEGTTVPLTPPVAALVPDLWRTPLVRRNSVQSPPSEAEVVQPTMTREQMMALRAEHREAARKRGLEHRAEVERRRQQHRPQR